MHRTDGKRGSRGRRSKSGHRDKSGRCGTAAVLVRTGRRAAGFSNCAAGSVLAASTVGGPRSSSDRFGWPRMVGPQAVDAALLWWWVSAGGNRA